MPVSFDESLPEFLKVLIAAGLDISAAGGAVVRDLRGRLSFVSRQALNQEVLAKVEKATSPDLAHYISPLGPVSDATTPGAEEILKSDMHTSETVLLPDANVAATVSLFDRRAAGADWLHAPSELSALPPTLVFASLKGGVGRSTALSVLAAELASKGFTLLVVDLDIEAPGIGTMLIESEATPRFGSLDFFVESGLREIDDSFLQDCIGSSWLGQGRGRIDVVPAYGTLSLAHPRNVLSKLARTYLEIQLTNGESISLLNRVQELVTRLTGLRRYDAVLVDSRAGLHESTAAAILGLGADVLLFGVDQRQTFVGYNILLQHLAQFPVRDAEHDWRYRLRMIQAKVTGEQSALRYRSQCYDLFSEAFYSADGTEAPVPGADFQFGIDDADAPHFPIVIAEDERYRLFDPVLDRAQLTSDTYNGAFKYFVDFCIERLQLETSEAS